MRTAHERFLDSKHRLAHQAIADTDSFEAACEASLLTLVAELPEGGESPNGDWASYCKLRGAKRVLEILRTLHISAETPKTEPFFNLQPPR